MTVPQSESVDDAIGAAAREIAAAGSIVMACHVNPDGDALGSMLGLVLALRAAGKDVTCLSADGVPDIYRFLPGAETIRRAAPERDWDLGIVLDSGDLDRIGGALPFIARARRLLNVDHHATAKGFGDVQLVNALAASTAEIVFELIRSMGLPVTPQIATCLFTGVTTDTGSFRFQNVTMSTLDTAADLVGAGAPLAEIAENVFDNRSFAATKLLGLALNAMQTTADGRIVWTRVTHEDFTRLGVTDEDTEGFVNYARNVRGAEVGLLFREISDGRARVSLRGKKTVDVGAIAKQFGGGGHRMAAGCTVGPTLADAERLVIAAAMEELRLADESLSS
jgi:phosphoesterase RecJ-like protein